MTPMIDVVFQLLIFFLTTAAVAQATRARLDLPAERGVSEPSPTGPGLVVALHADGRVEVSGRDVTIAELGTLAREAIVAHGAHVPVIRADRTTAAQRLNDVMDACREAGFQGVRIATAPGGAP